MSKRKPYNLNTAPDGAPEMWRSLEDKSRSTEDKNNLGETEFQSGLLDAKSMISRRSFLAFTGATSAALSLEGCIRRPAEKILPYSQAPEYVVPGNPMHYATVTERRGDALGLLVTSHEGRPTKIEGNPNQSESLGATDVFAQASILNLYNPDRAKFPTKKSSESTRVKITAAEFEKELNAAFEKHQADQGLGLRILVEPTNSPSVVNAKKAVLDKFPKAQIHTFTSVNESNKLLGAKAAFGKPVETVIDYEKAETVLSIDADFLSMEQGAVKAAQGFAKWRKIDSPKKKMNRLYAVESTFSVTGAQADHRLRLLPSQIGSFLKALAKELNQNHGISLSGELSTSVAKASTESFASKWISEVAKELASNAGKGAIVVGASQPPSVHALGHALNAALQNNKEVFSYYDIADTTASLDQVQDLASLKADISKGLVQSLFILGGNPVYQAPSDLKLGETISSAKSLKTFHLSITTNETTKFSDLHFPGTHELEAWGDQQAVNGLRSIQQPLVAPLFGGKSVLEMLHSIAGGGFKAFSQSKGYDIVRETFASSQGSKSFNIDLRQAWRNALHQGVIESSKSSSINSALTLDQGAITKAANQIRAQKPANDSSFEVVFAPDYRMFDGRFNNNPWMLELPDPLTKLVWDNGALVSPATAKELGIEKGDILKVSNKAGSSIEIPAWVLPGHADKTLTLTLGWGREVAGQYGKGTGFDVSALRTASAFWNGADISVTKTSKTYSLVETQEHGYMEGRPIAIDAPLSEYKKQPDFASWRTVEFTTPPLWKEVDYSDNNKWGMTIDLSACTGCNTCVIACQSENNIPVVGKREVARGREMSWMRIDRYFVGDDVDNPEIALQPVACQHCEEAPCENVCPVNATAHSPEGLNDMAYNRCIGTRYCANNCPYKVRRFNYLSWHDYSDPHGDIPIEKKMQFNPNVTVRMRGVMEKCSYCVQRIQEAKIHANSENRKIREGEIVTACQQACPSQAIVFGDLNDSKSKVSKLAKMNRQYKLLAEVGAQPRTTFLAKIRNPNPALEPKKAKPTKKHAAFAKTQEQMS